MSEIATSLVTAARALVVRAAVQLCLGIVLVLAAIAAYAACLTLLAIEAHARWAATGVAGCLLVCFTLTALAAAAGIAVINRRKDASSSAQSPQQDDKSIEAAHRAEEPVDEPAPRPRKEMRDEVASALAAVAVLVAAAVVIGPRRIARWGVRAASLMNFVSTLAPLVSAEATPSEPGDEPQPAQPSQKNPQDEA